MRAAKHEDEKVLDCVRDGSSGRQSNGSFSASPNVSSCALTAHSAGQLRFPLTA